jgi:hypothetical protein
MLFNEKIISNLTLELFKLFQKYSDTFSVSNEEKALLRNEVSILRAISPILMKAYLILYETNLWLLMLMYPQ